LTLSHVVHIHTSWYWRFYGIALHLFTAAHTGAAQATTPWKIFIDYLVH